MTSRDLLARLAEQTRAAHESGLVEFRRLVVEAGHDPEHLDPSTLPDEMHATYRALVDVQTVADRLGRYAKTHGVADRLLPVLVAIKPVGVSS